MKQNQQVINKIIELCAGLDLPTCHHRYDAAKRIILELQAIGGFPSSSAAYDQAIHAFDVAFLGGVAA